MLYPNLSINIKPKRAPGLEDASPVINTPVILDLAVQMSDEKNSFAFSSHQPSLNQFKLDQDKHLGSNSLQTPIIELNHHNAPFFQNSQVSPGDNLNDFVAPNDILNTYTSANSTSTSTTTNANLNLNANNYNDLNSTHQIAIISDLSDTHLNDSHQLNLASNKLIHVTKQEQNTSMSQQQNDYQNHFIITSTAPSYTTNQQQLNQYTSNLLNHQQNDLNDNIPLTTHLNHDLHSLTYTELKPSNQQQTLLIPNSVSDINGGYKQKQQHQLQPSTSSMANNYLSPSSPAESLSSHTSSSNLDNADLYGSSSYARAEASGSTSRGRRYTQIVNDRLEKKSRLTKKQKYDAMINEEKELQRNNEQLKSDIDGLENLIAHYKQTIMNTVKKNK